MADVLAAVQVEDFLGDVCRVIRHALDGFGDGHQVQRAGDRLRILDHVTRQLPRELLVDVIDRFVPRDDLDSELVVRIDECGDAVAQHLLRDVGHERDVDERLEQRLGIQLARAPCDFGRLIGDAFEVAGDFRRCEHQPAVLGDRTVRGHVGDDHFVDLDFEPIDRRILGLDDVAKLVVALHERTHGERKVPFGEARHHQQLLTDVGELLFPELAHRFVKGVRCLCLCAKRFLTSRGSCN